MTRNKCTSHINSCVSNVIIDTFSELVKIMGMYMNLGRG